VSYKDRGIRRGPKCSENITAKMEVNELQEFLQSFTNVEYLDRWASGHVYRIFKETGTQYMYTYR